MKKLGIIMAGILALYIVPGIKDAYDGILDELIGIGNPYGFTLSTFETAFFQSLPLVLLIMIAVITVAKLLRKSEGEPKE